MMEASKKVNDSVQATEMSNLMILAPHKAKYYRRYNLQWLFQYADYNTKKCKVVRHGGEPYIVSPYALIWDGDYYYVVGYSEKRKIIQCFWLDRIFHTPEMLDEDAVVYSA